MKKSSDINEGIWILAVVSFVTAFLSIGIGLQVISLFDVLRGTGGIPLSDPSTGSALGTLNPGIFLGLGLFLVTLGIFAYFLGRSTLRAKKWSRIAFAVIAVMYVVSAIYMFFKSLFISGIIGLGIAGLLIWYLYFKESTKKYFKN